MADNATLWWLSRHGLGRHSPTADWHRAVWMERDAMRCHQKDAARGHGVDDNSPPNDCASPSIANMRMTSFHGIYCYYTEYVGGYMGYMRASLHVHAVLAQSIHPSIRISTTSHPALEGPSQLTPRSVWDSPTTPLWCGARDNVSVDAKAGSPPHCHAHPI